MTSAAVVRSMRESDLAAVDVVLRAALGRPSSFLDHARLTRRLQPDGVFVAERDGAKVDHADPPLESGAESLRHPLRGPPAETDQQITFPARLTEKELQGPRELVGDVDHAATGWRGSFACAAPRPQHARRLAVESQLHLKRNGNGLDTLLDLLDVLIERFVPV
jgi:hypothetical protein